MVEVLGHTRSLPSIQAQVSSLYDFVGSSEACTAVTPDIINLGARLMLIDNKRTTLLRWLDGQDQSAKHLQEFQKCVKGTGDWLLRMDTYIEWKSNHGRVLWLNGIGKSPFTSFSQC